MTKNKSTRLCDLALVSTPIKKGILCNLTGKDWIYSCLDGIAFFEDNW